MTHSIIERASYRADLQCTLHIVHLYSVTVYNQVYNAVLHYTMNILSYAVGLYVVHSVYTCVRTMSHTIHYDVTVYDVNKGNALNEDRVQGCSSVRTTCRYMS